MQLADKNIFYLATFLADNFPEVSQLICESDPENPAHGFISHNIPEQLKKAGSMLESVFGKDKLMITYLHEISEAKPTLVFSFNNHARITPQYWAFLSILKEEVKI